ncbi:(2Fe-2S) ferredoxin [Oikeobacillus pervagus]|uniref:(2Fe-2S) ferredoxin n=2 Tax=Oikeobacillus pervagus TaxID=1325931 RepID=A0AAJ1T3L9_9BACI|nr:(2Fe-2S) ferredoxin [Oikeobacillus pervagus]
MWHKAIVHLHTNPYLPEDRGFFVGIIFILKMGGARMTTWNLQDMQKHVLICNGSSCMRKGGEEVTQAIRKEITTRELDRYIHTSRTRCNGRCKDACVVIVYPDAVWYEGIDVDSAKELVHSHLENNQILKSKVIYERTQTGMSLKNNRVKGIEKEKQEAKKEEVL